MIWLWFVSLCSFFVKGVCGFANTLVFTTLLSFSNSILQISPIILLLNYPSNMIMAWNGRKSIDLKICLPLCIMVVAGVIPGTILFKNVDTGLVEIIFGALVLLLALDMLFRKPKKTETARRLDWKMACLGILSGFVCGFCGIGVSIGAYIAKVTDNTKAFKANACFVFFVAESIKTLMFACLGILTADVLKQTLILFPISMVGLWLGIKSSNTIKEATARKIVLIMLLFSGLGLVINNL